MHFVSEAWVSLKKAGELNLSFPRLTKLTGKGFSLTSEKQEKLFHRFKGTVDDFWLRFENLKPETIVQLIQRIRQLLGLHARTQGNGPANALMQ